MLFYLSFATDADFLGGTIVDARDEVDAVDVATSLGRNPGGEIAIIKVPEEAMNEPDVRVLRAKLVTEQEMLRLGGRKLGELSDEDQAALNALGRIFCSPRNQK